MRLWSLHPSYLDSKGLVAVWREALLAKAVLEGKTIGYKNHSQLIRFKLEKNNISFINQYLIYIYEEAIIRKYNFDKNKIDWHLKKEYLKVTKGQLKYEFNHLILKLKKRDKKKYKEILKSFIIMPNPLFKVVEGDVESWEKI